MSVKPGAWLSLGAVLSIANAQCHPGSAFCETYVVLKMNLRRRALPALELFEPM
jgi:hypothetical protein